MILGRLELRNWTERWAVLHGSLSPLCGMLRMAATGIGASKTAIRPGPALGGEKARAINAPKPSTGQGDDSGPGSA